MYLNSIQVVGPPVAAPLQIVNPTTSEKAANPLSTIQLRFPTPQPTSTSSSLRLNHPITRRSPQPHYIFLTITSISTTYTTTILLGNSFPTFATSSQSTTPKAIIPEVPGIPTGTIVGIVVGCIVVFLVLGIVFYGYAWRKNFYRNNRKRGSRSSKSRSANSSGGSVSSGGNSSTEVCIINFPSFVMPKLT